jgi:hypothetical protein
MLRSGFDGREDDFGQAKGEHVRDYLSGSNDCRQHIGGKAMLATRAASGKV